MSEKESITELLKMWQDGDSQSEERLYQQVLPILRKQAQLIRNDHNGMVELDTTEVLHEAYFKLNDVRQFAFSDRAHFFAISAKVIRFLVIDYMRKQTSLKRGGRLPLISIDEAEHSPVKSYDTGVDWLTVEQAIKELHEVDPVSARVVEMKFFSSMTLKEMAEVCSCSVMTIRRKWRFAKVWLATKLEDADCQPS